MATPQVQVEVGFARVLAVRYGLRRGLGFGFALRGGDSQVMRADTVKADYSGGCVVPLIFGGISS